jgi:hypothetical protein
MFFCDRDVFAMLEGRTIADLINESLLVLCSTQCSTEHQQLVVLPPTTALQGVTGCYRGVTVVVFLKMVSELQRYWITAFLKLRVSE